MHRRLGDLWEAAGSPDGPGGRMAAWAGQTFADLYVLRLASRRTFRRLDAGGIPGPDASIDKILMASAEQALFDGASEILPEVLLAGDDADAATWRSD